MEKNEAIKKITALQRDMARFMRRNAFKHWVTLSLTTAQAKALFCIVDNEKISSKQLAAIFEVTPANITGIIDKLIEQGFVRRVENSQDRRVFFLESTQAGKTLIDNLDQLASEHSAQMLSALNEEELKHVYLGLSAFLKAIQTKLPAGSVSTPDEVGQ